MGVRNLVIFSFVEGIFTVSIDIDLSATVLLLVVKIRVSQRLSIFFGKMSSIHHVC